MSRGAFYLSTGMIGTIGTNGISLIPLVCYAKRAKKSHALRNLNFNEESPQMGRPQIDSDFVFY